MSSDDRARHLGPFGGRLWLAAGLGGLSTATFFGGLSVTFVALYGFDLTANTRVMTAVLSASFISGVAYWTVVEVARFDRRRPLGLLGLSCALWGWVGFRMMLERTATLISAQRLLSIFPLERFEIVHLGVITTLAVAISQILYPLTRSSAPPPGRG